MKFCITYGIVTPESAEIGDYDETGFILENASLRDAIQVLFRTRTNLVDGIESRENSGAWFTVHNMAEFETGAYETRELHKPATMTESSWSRLCRLLED